ncbi:MAG: hypothetical protein RIF33_19100 [Cyclobacteriaceae bacterium]
MKKDIPFEPVTGVLIAIVPQNDANLKQPWDVYIINKNLIELNTVMVTSKGYGSINGENKKTSTLRHVIEQLNQESYAKIEPIDPSVFALTNEYWVSYYILDQIFDKKFIFVPESIQETNLTYIEALNAKGILHP